MVLLLVVAFGSQSTNRTEPLFDGADDAMAIFLALRSPELEVLGLTTTFGNVHTALATRNALHLVPPPTFLPLSLSPPCWPVPPTSNRGSHLLLMCVIQLEAVGRTDIPVAEGSHVTIKVAISASLFLLPRRIDVQLSTLQRPHQTQREKKIKESQ
jgi:hypothetical protein